MLRLLLRTGLSPRVRGNPALESQTTVLVGSIPACAGEPPPLHRPIPKSAVYPRVCGGTGKSLTVATSPRGLSPRVRGNRDIALPESSGYGSIPACAGEPSLGSTRTTPATVYPRVCGGTALTAVVTPPTMGLSPRVRGNRWIEYQTAFATRSIPACAGEPYVEGECPVDGTVYPRVCGGTESMPPDGTAARGLSPRVRGNPARFQSQPRCPRSIPACAGEPAYSLLRRTQRGVYPRVCGGTLLSGEQPLHICGLSPRVRGNPAPEGNPDVSPGSIPACAGEPTRGWSGSVGGEVYPRVCGGTTAVPNVTPVVDGLSPRVRGNRSHVPKDIVGHRSIPACAGEPPSHLYQGQGVGVYPRVCGGTRVRPPATCPSGGLSPRVRGNQLPLTSLTP